jgi:signal recognition particle GTPase
VNRLIKQFMQTRKMLKRFGKGGMKDIGRLLSNS